MKPSDPEVLAAYVKKTVATAPPLTREQVDELAMLFRATESRRVRR